MGVGVLVCVRNGSRDWGGNSGGSWNRLVISFSRDPIIFCGGISSTGVGRDGFVG